MVAQQRVGYGFDVPRKRGESNFTTSWDPCNMYIPDRCLAQVKSCVVAKSTALLTRYIYNIVLYGSIIVVTYIHACARWEKSAWAAIDSEPRSDGTQVLPEEAKKWRVLLDSVGPPGDSESC